MSKNIVSAAISHVHNWIIKGDYEDAYDEGSQAGYDEGYQEGLSVAKSEGAKLWKYLHQWLERRGKIERHEECSINDLMDRLHEYESELKDAAGRAAIRKGEP